MTPRSEQDVILEHALRNEENLQIALKIGAAYPELCSRVIADFNKSVEHELASRLGARWKTGRCQDSLQLAERSVEFLVADFLDHPGQFRIVLGGDGLGYPKWAWLGVRSAGNSELHQHVKNVIVQDCGAGRVGDPSFWWRYLDKPYSYWGSEDATLLFFRKGEALDYLVRGLVSLAHAIERGLIPGESSDARI